MLVRAAARQQHDKQRDHVRTQVEDRVADKARDRLDREVHIRLETAYQQFITRLVEPLQRLHLEPKPVEMKTTEERLIIRARAAGHNQLAAFTPRPRAIAGNLFSMQINETTINNLIQQLHLDGKRSDLKGLIDSAAAKLGRPLQDVTETLPEDVTVELAPEDALHVDFDEDCVTLTINIRQLRAGGRRWNDFSVRGHYRPELNGLEVDFARDGGIELVGEGLSFRDQIALRGIFTKVLSRNRRWRLVPLKLARDPRLADLGICQVEIQSGWIGISIAPGTGRRDLVAGRQKR
jgi:hypothetical protein